MENLLFLSAHWPSEKSRQAGQKTAYRNLCWLAERYVVHLVTFRSEGDREAAIWPLNQLCAQTTIFEVDFATRLRGLFANPLLPLTIVARSSMGVRLRIRELLATQNIRRVHFEWSQLAQYVDECPTVQHRTLYVHDVLSQSAERSAKRKGGWFRRLEAKRVAIWEQKTYPKLTRLFVPSAKDASLLGADVQSRIRILPLYFDLYKSMVPRDFQGVLRLLFWGALRRSENVEGARWLCSKVAPLLRAIGIPFEIVIAGSNPPRDIESMRSPDIEVTGFIANPAEVFGRAHLAVLPLLEGAGVKVKVLECLASGLPVLTTYIGGEGIEADEEDGLFILPSDPAKFTAAVAHFSRNRSLLSRLSLAAMAWGSGQDRDLRNILIDESER